jgi:hypothetical protein
MEIRRRCPKCAVVFCFSATAGTGETGQHEVCPRCGGRLSVASRFSLLPVVQVGFSPVAALTPSTPAVTETQMVMPIEAAPPIDVHEQDEAVPGLPVKVCPWCRFRLLEIELEDCPRCRRKLEC